MKIQELSQEYLALLKSIVGDYLQVLEDEALEAMSTNDMTNYQDIKDEMVDLECIHSKLDIGLAIAQNRPELNVSSK